MLRVSQFLLEASLAIAVVALMVAPSPLSVHAQGPIKVEYYVDPENPEATRDSYIRMLIYDAEGKAINDAKVMFAADMKHDMSAGAMPASMKPIRQEGQKEGRPGQYVVHTTFSMPGTWEAKVEVETSSGKWTESFPIEVIEPKPFSGVNWPIIGGAVLVLALVVGVPAVLRARSRSQWTEQEEE